MTKLIFSIGLLQFVDRYFHNLLQITQEKTPYEGGRFVMKIAFPPNYPMTPPIIKFMTRIYHPSITNSGEICLRLLKSEWKVGVKLHKVLDAILNILAEPSPDEPLVPEIGSLLKTDKAKFEATAKHWTDLYAK